MADWGDQEQLSLAYVMAVAAAAGCVCEQSFRGLDNAGVDLMVFPRTSLGDLPQLHLQVKSKQSMEVASGDSFAFELSLRGAPPATGTSRQRVRIPLSQVFEPGALRAMITNSKTVGTSAHEGR